MHEQIKINSKSLQNQLKMTLFYIIAAGKKEAEKISRALLKKKLAACCNMFPIKSMYWWNGKLEKANEYAILCKTTNKKSKMLEHEIKKIHSYEVPCLVRLNAKVNKEYEKYKNLLYLS